MLTSESNDNLVFNHRTLRLIIGALAFAFPAMVIALTGKVTSSISASYWEPETRDVFVGFLFVVGTLLISYKGHLQSKPKDPSESLLKWILSFKWLKRYQEDVVSTIGGTAAIFAALYPTACDGCSMDKRAIIHLTGAFILFSTVVYFCMIAFLRSLNHKLLNHFINPTEEERLKLRHVNPNEIWHYIKRIETIRATKSQAGISLPIRFWNFLTLEIQIFLATASGAFEQARREKGSKNLLKVSQMYRAEVARGRVYVVCGSLITLILSTFIFMLVINPGFATHSIATFIVETLALVLFGVAWITASKLEYIAQIVKWLKSLKKEPISENQLTQPQTSL